MAPEEPSKGFDRSGGRSGRLMIWVWSTTRDARRASHLTVPLLGAANIALYARAYTYLKRKSILNT